MVQQIKKMEIIPTTTQLTDHFATAIEVAPSSSATRSTTQAISGSNFVGGRIGDAIGVHATSEGPAGGTIVLSQAGSYKMFLAGLGPSNSRTLTLGANIASVKKVIGESDCSSGCGTTSQGTLYVNVVVSANGNGQANTITVSAAE